MTSIPISIGSSSAGNSRPLNILKDLPRVADLIEMCFAKNMDREGRSYIRQLRIASQDGSIMRWATKAFESASMPLSGFVWEQGNQIIGNASLVPFRHKGKLIYLIANVATHPSHRRKGIARSLTEKIIDHANQRAAREIWLHVRTDTLGAVQMYSDLGFVERARRNTWHMENDAQHSTSINSHRASSSGTVTITKRFSRFWPQQLIWLNQVHPIEVEWYRNIKWRSLNPGLWNWLYHLFIEIDLRQWAVQKDGHLEGVLTWLPTMRNSALWLACNPNADPESIALLLNKAHHNLGVHKRLTLEHPAGVQENPIQAAGFKKFRTLIWMCKVRAT